VMAKYFESVDEIERILSRGNLEDLVGALENEFFEAKGEPWQLEIELEKFKFAKAVTAMANSRGGIILVGVAARGSQTHRRDEVLEQQRYLPESMTPDDRYMHILADWVHPLPEGIDVKWYNDSKNPTRGIIGVHIPNQNDELRPFFVKRYFEEAGKRLGAAVCLVQRFGATTKETPVYELHMLLREGRRVDLIHQKLDAIIAKIEAGASPIEK
jgi:hypothetical protein